jgi:hypothetical protein
VQAETAKWDTRSGGSAGVPLQRSMDSLKFRIQSGADLRGPPQALQSSGHLQQRKQAGSVGPFEPSQVGETARVDGGSPCPAASGADPLSEAEPVSASDDEPAASGTHRASVVSSASRSTGLEM